MTFYPLFLIVSSLESNIKVDHLQRVVAATDVNSPPWTTAGWLIHDKILSELKSFVFILQYRLRIIPLPTKTSIPPFYENSQ